MYGKNWKKIESIVKTRTGSQIRSHAQKFFNKLERKCDGDENIEHPIQTGLPANGAGKRYSKAAALSNSLSLLVSWLFSSIEALRLT